MKTEITSAEAVTSFPVVFTREEFKKAVVEGMLVLACKTNFTFSVNGSSNESSERVWSLLSPRPYDSETFTDLGVKPEHMELTFADVERLSIVETLIQLYDYGIHGIHDTAAGRIDYCDGYENQVARIFYDLHHSTFLQEWGNDGRSSCAIAVEKCLYVCEIANARLMLEGSDEGFFLDDRDVGFLSIRQMALLSGMTEASIRTLASRGRKSQQGSSIESASQLITTNDGKNTSIAIADAKTWLKAKGRYVPTSRKMTTGSGDLTSRKFASIRELTDAIEERKEFLIEKHGNEVMTERIASSGVEHSFIEVIPGIGIGRNAIKQDQLLDHDLMLRFAEILELPAEIFALRVAETVMQEKLQAIEKKLKQVQQTK